MDALLNYRFDNPIVANPDRQFPVQLIGGTVVQTTIDSELGKLHGATDLGNSGRGVVNIQTLPLDFAQFCIRIVIQASGPVMGRQNLVESSRLPFALFLDRSERAGEFVAVASVRPSAHGWHSTTTQFHHRLTPNTWYTIDLVYDVDTLAIFVDGVIAAVQSFPHGRITQLSGQDLFIGTAIDGVRNHFDGKVAALQLWAGIPEELERELDARRSHPEWFISYKRLAAASAVDLGAPTAAIAFNPEAGAYLQPHVGGVIMYRDSAGVAFEMHGSIHQCYKDYDRKSELGYPTSDEGNASPRVGGRKNTFSKGAIYWSATTGAAPVTDRIYLSYEDIEGIDIIGFPTAPATTVGGGTQQQFQHGRMYHQTGTPAAHEVHGGILAKYLQLGGTTAWGFPVSDETDVKKDGATIGRASEFERCTIYWSQRTGAFEVHGDIRTRYRDMGGPGGELGFPTSDELDIPEEAGAGRFNTFERGSLCWYGSLSSTIVARPFTLFLDRIETAESEGLLGQGDNDIYLREVTVEEGGRTVYSQRHPRDGDWSGNIVEVNLAIPPLIVPNRPDKTVVFTVDVWESDPGNDDHLGKYRKRLGPENAWGFRKEEGVFNSGPVDKIRNILWSVKPQVDISALSEPEKFWATKNIGTPVIPYQRYAAAFRDVDSESEWWDIPDWLDKAFYELVVDTLASPGNCFGMSVEAIHARKGLSRFSLPLNRFKDWAQLEPEFNVKHCYQVGASAIWWFIDQFLTGNTHDPKDVFRNSRDAFLRGRHPVLCISKNYDFSGSPHCILPIRWRDDTKPWRIDISDPSRPKEVRELTVDPDENTFRYVGATTYEGSEWSGGRLHYMPFDVLDRRPRTPIWDAIMLLLTGTVVIVGADARTESITDHAGNDLDGYGERAKQILQRDGSIQDFFIGYKGFDGDGAVAGEFLAQMGRQARLLPVGGIVADPTLISQLLLRDLIADRALRAVNSELADNPTVNNALSNRTVAHILADPVLSKRLTPAALDALKTAASAIKRGDFVHKLVGLRPGSLRYILKHGQTKIQLSASMIATERNEIRVRDVGTARWSVGMAGSRAKRTNLLFDSKLGLGRDGVTLTVNDVPMPGAPETRLNLNPGLGGIEIVAAGGRVELPVLLQMNVGGRIQERRFRVPMEGGVRLQLSTVLSTGDLSISRIAQLFGPASSRSLLRPE